MVSGADILALRGEGAFRRAALELFRYQAEHCPPYRDYLALLGIDPARVSEVERIPCLPVELFKTHEVYCAPHPPEVVFTSSTTGGGLPSRHAMADRGWYERVFTACFVRFYGAPARLSLYALLPSYLEREGSSLVYMADRLIAACGSGGFYLHDYDKLLADMARDPKPKILLGVSYALWELAERGSVRLEKTIVMETGGMKGRREELPKEAFHRILCRAFGVRSVHSEYGMAELTSQAYSAGGGVFAAPPWMRVLVRDANDPFEVLPAGRRGGVNVIDLANIHSCAFLQTQDAGVVLPDGRFEIAGRLDRSETRGCNLLVQ